MQYLPTLFETISAEATLPDWQLDAKIVSKYDWARAEGAVASECSDWGGIR